ncbi:MAG TPA: hypothetical protein VEK11_24775 [Thermoanaerobaculia bacterium]|jgi:hypothetical protein|nr:hypothetical protein [Thermoanaerobaculia bacterium]
MKPTRRLLFAVLMSLSTAAWAQADPKASFERLKSLAGTWRGTIATTPAAPEIDGTVMTVTLRVTSMGHVLMHEMTGVGRPDDPITMLYLHEGRLQLTHYCDAGNRPRMWGVIAPDEKSVKFESFEIAGSMEYGHMHGAIFTFVADDRHIEEWTYMRPDGKPVQARVELRRVK